MSDMIVAFVATAGGVAIFALCVALIVAVLYAAYYGIHAIWTIATSWRRR